MNEGKYGKDKGRVHRGWNVAAAAELISHEQPPTCLQNTFVNRLAHDYTTWASDPELRRRRLRAEPVVPYAPL